MAGTNEKIVGLEGAYLSIGGKEITGFGSDALDIPTPEGKIVSKAGLDGVAWIKVIPASLEVEVTVVLLSDSPSVKVLKTFEKTFAIVPFYFEWEDLGIVVDALQGRVEEVGSLKVSPDMPETTFKVTIKNINEMKGL